MMPNPSFERTSRKKPREAAQFKRYYFAQPLTFISRHNESLISV